MGTRMKLSAFAIILSLGGLAAAALAQQTSAPATPAAPPQPVLAPVTAPDKTNITPDTVVLTIGAETLTRAQFETLLAALSANGRPAKTEAQKRQVAEQYAELEVMVQEARRRKLDEDPEVKQMMSIQNDSVLANSLAKRISEDTHFTELDLRAYYDAHKGDFEEAKGSHILIRFKGSAVPLKANEKDLTQEEALAKAEELRKQILAGADFATLAKTNSDDTGSAVKGGDLGSFRKGQMVPAFDQAAFAVPVGQVSEPVKTQFGYHLIKITERTSKTFEDARPQIEKELKPQMTRDAVAQIKAHTAVTLNDDYFGGAPTSGPQNLPTPAAPSQK
jgi:peptidyl-prolyl cis-trans isomerase C